MPEIFRNGKNYGAALPEGGLEGQALIKRTNGDGDVTWGDAGGAVFCYIVGNTPYAANWLSLTANGTPLTPNPKLIYLILTQGDYYHNFVRWDATNTVYLPVAAGGGGGGGAVFSYIDSTKTALNADWLLKESGGATINPKNGELYLILTSGDYYNSLYRFDETTNKYVLVQSADGGVIFATIDSTKTALNSDWLKNLNNTTIVPKVGQLYLILTSGDYYNSIYRFDSATSKYVLVVSNTGGVIFTNIDSSKTALDPDWLKNTLNNTITPKEGILYLVLTSGDYQNSIYRFDETASKYVLVSNGTLGGVVFSYIDSSKTALNSDWLKNGNSNTISPNVGDLYVVLTSGDYYNSVYRYDSGTSKYVLVIDGNPGGVVFSYVDSSKTALDSNWLKNANNNTISPKVGYTYLVVSAGEFKDSVFRYDSSTSKYVLVSRPVQFSSMPSPSAYYNGVTIQYTGATNSSYTHNFFYECKNVSGSYKWVLQIVEEDEIIEMSKATFDALPLATKNNGKTYFLPDADMDVHYAVDSGCLPVGTIIHIFSTSPPLYYLLCDGSVYNIIDYPELSTYFEVQYGAKNIFGGNGTTTFAVPDMNSGENADPLITLLPVGISPIYCIAYKDVYVKPQLDYTNQEQIIGLWEDGSYKYQISITGTTINSTEGLIPTGLSGKGVTYAEIERFQVSNGAYIKNLLDSVAISEDGANIAMVADTLSLFKNKTFHATINYKRSTL